MSARRIGGAIGVVTLAASGTYVYVYLQRWEWNRALMSGVMFVAAEVGLATLLLAGRMRRLGDDVTAVQLQLREQRTLQHLRANAPAPRDHFAWISRPQHLNVFIPVLLGAGVLLSGLAWAVERLSRLTATPALERGLARRLAALAPPDGGFLAAPAKLDDTADLLRRPRAAAPPVP